MQEEFPKCPICGSTNGYKLSGIIGKYAQCLTCMTKWQLFVKDKRILELTLHEFPKDGSSSYTITSTKKPLFTIIGTRLPTDFWKNLKLDKEVNWKFLSKNVSSDVSKAVFTEKGEKLLHQWEGTRAVVEKSVIKGNTVENTKWELGILLLSTQKLRWLARRERGFLKKVTSFLVVYEAPLQEVRGISGDTGDSRNWQSPKKITVVDSRGETAFNLQYAFLELFKSIIGNAIEIRKKEIEAEKRKARVHIMLDFSSLKDYMKKGGLVLQTVKCPFCSGPLKLPESGNQTTCEHCGNTIYAQDIFEKVKALIG